MVEGVCFEHRCALCVPQVRILSHPSEIKKNILKNCFYTMYPIFFAIRPMFAGTERQLLAKKAFLSNISVSYISRKHSPFRSVFVYDMFMIKPNFLDLAATKKFMNLYSFCLFACFFEGYIMSAETIKSVSLLKRETYVFLFLQLTVFPLLISILKILFLSISSKRCLR